MNSIMEKDILMELNAFIAGASASEGGRVFTLDVSKTAMNLLKALPTARSAVLEYFCNLFDAAIKNYIIRIETEIATGQMPETCSREEATVAEIHSVLCNLVLKNPSAWAPIISTWSLELLGELSTKYAGRAHVSTSAGLNEILQLWMGCRSTRTLIDIATQCLTCLMDTDSETWMNALLDTSVKHSPNFDWVVAHVGSCFPETVITKVLSCGLKDFCQYKSAEIGGKSAKLMSVVGILGHLAGSRLADIKTALSELFDWSRSENTETDNEKRIQKAAVVPYLLQLASMSDVLLKAVASDTARALEGNNLADMSRIHAVDWCKYFGGTRALQNLLVHLTLQCEKDGLKIMGLLLKHRSDEEVGVACRDILESVLQELDSIARTDGDTGLMKCLTSEGDRLNEMVASDDKLEHETAARLLLTQSSPVLIRAASFLLRRAKTNDHLAVLVRLVKAQPDRLSEALKRAALEEESTSIWSNLVTLLKWEASGKISFGATLAALDSLSRLIRILGDETAKEDARDSAAEIAYISICIIQAKPPPSELLGLSKSIVSYLMMTCSTVDTVTKEKRAKLSCALLERCSTRSKAARVLVLRELLDRSLFRREATLFGAEPKEKQPPTTDETSLLLKRNHRQNSSVLVAQRKSSIFHAGVIGAGARRNIAPERLPDKITHRNRELLIRAIKACCGEPANQEALTLLSLLLVQFVSPDVMYNGLPWPEEDFSKVTIERDLHIQRSFSKTPVLWELLMLAAVHRPVLCYCSVLLRALAATTLHRWSAQQNPEPDKDLLDCTTRLLDILAAGQLLPPPLANIRDLLPHLRAIEVASLLRDCVWNYMRDHVPSPALFGCDTSGLHWRDPTVARPPPPFRDAVRLTLMRNIDRLADHYTYLFNNQINK